MTKHEHVPRHIAIIMDGNGRWAKNRLLPRHMGHAAGSEAFRKIAYHCRDIGVEYLTAYAFSTENWKRPQEEIDEIFRLLHKYLDETLETMLKDHVRLRFLGDLSVLPPGLAERVQRAHTISEGFPEKLCQINICLNYGGRDEILRAVKALLKGAPGELTAEAFAGCLDTAGIPDPDLLIRPGGDKRLSNFLLWEIAYTELYFTKTLWPDFGVRELDRAVRDYAGRQRRFGGI